MNPFPGLRPFLFDDSHLFFGRDTQITELASRLRKNRFLAVVGTSGSGKSSLVRAGLLPELLSGTMASAGSSWESATMRPGGDPLTNLARSLVEAGLYDQDEPEIISQVRATLTRSGLGLLEAVRQSDKEKKSNLLLVVDQFEEIFRFRNSEDATDEQAAFFVNLLLEATAQSELPIYIIITMRSDFLGDCSRFPRLADTVNEGEFLIPRLNRDQRKEAITGPVQVAGGQIADRLLSRLLNDIGDDPDQLPILQHALMRMWTYWQATDQTKALDLDDYRATGGMTEALSKHAEEVFSSLPSDRHRWIAEKLFKSLTEKVEEGRGIRKPMKFKDLCAVIADDPEKISHVIDEYRAPGRTFLMPTAETEIKATTNIDISHESLMRVWAKLRTWVDDEAQSARIYQRLADTAQLNQLGKAGLYREPELSIARAWLTANQPNASWAGQYKGNFDAAMGYLQMSIDSAEQEARAQEAARQHELAMAKSLAAAERQRAEEQNAFAQRLKWLVRGLGVVAVVAVGAMVFALSARREAQKNAEIARLGEQKSQRLTYASDINALQGALDKNNLGRARVLLDRQRPAAGAPDLRGWEWRYLWQLCQSGAQKILKAPAPEEVSAISVSADGAWAAVGTREKGQLSLHHLKTGEKLELPMPAGSHCRAVFSPTEPLLAFGGRPLNMGTTPSPAMAPEARVVQIWDLQQRRVIRSLSITGACAGLAFSADGRTLVIGDAAGNNQGGISRWRVVDGAKLSTIPTAISAGGYSQVFALTPDASTVAFGSALSTTSNQTGIRVVDLTSGQLKWQQTISENSIMCLAFSPDGQRLASGAGFADTKIDLWETASGRQIGRLEGQRGWTGGVQFLADGQHLLSGSGDQVIRLWDLETRTIVRAFRGHQSEVRTFALAPDQQSFVSGCKDGSAYLWNLNEDRAAATHGKISSGPSAENKYFAWTFSADSRALVTLANDGRLTRWEGRNFDQPTPLLPLDLGRKGPDDLESGGNNTGAPNCVFDRARPRLALVTPTGQVQVWDWALGQRVREWPANADQGQAIVSRFSADGQTLGLSTFHPTTRAYHYREWAIATGQETRAIALPPAKPGSRRILAHAPGANELLLISTEDNASMRYDFAAARFIPTTSLNLQQQSGRPQFSVDGRYLFAASAMGEVRVFDATTLQETAKLRGFMFGAHSVGFTPDGQRLVTGSGTQESITIWDQGNYERLLTFPTTDGGFGSTGFSPDGNVLVGRSGSGNVFFWRAPSFEEIAQTEARSAKL